MRITTAIVLFLLLSISAFAQKQAELELIDKFGEQKCDQLLTKIDDLMLALVKSSGAKGYIVMSRDTNDPFSIFYYEHNLRIAIAMRKFDPERIEFIRGPDKAGVETDLWIAHDGVSRPDVQGIKWDYKLPTNLKPVKLGADSWLSEMCEDAFSYDYYSKFLLANPGLRANIVVRRRTKAQFQHEERRLLGSLAGKYHVPGKQIRFYYLKSRKPDVEYWLVRGRRT